jgi:hypothetical protein
MKKRLSCLLLSILMVALCFTGCAEKTSAEVLEKIGEESSDGAVMLSMYLLSESAVSQEQELAMEAAVNAITEKEFKVRLDLRYYTADEYYTKLGADLARMTEYYDGEAIGKEKEEPVYTDEDGLPVTYYPPIEEFDVDIFYLGGYDKYLEYKSAGYIKDISSEVDGSAKAIKAVVNNNLLNQVRVLNGGFDIIPVNRAIGEYTYILLNKDVLKGTQYSAKDITSLAGENCQDLLSIVSEMYADEYVPLKSYTDELDLLNVKYFNVDSNGFLNDNFSVIAGTYNPAWTYGAVGSYPTMSAITNTVDNGDLSALDQIKVLKGYELAGYYGTEEDADKPFAVGYIKGGLEVVDEYSDEYEVVPVGMPTLKTEDIYEHAFAISEDTNSVLKSTEILAYLNTNEEFRNLLLYGIENENYTWVDAVDENGNPILDENGLVYKVVSRITDKAERVYNMDVYKTGNTTIAYPEVGTDPRTNEYALTQNKDIVLDYTLGFVLYKASFAELGEVDLTAIKAVSEASAAIYDKILAADTSEKLDAALAELEALAASENVFAVLGITAVADDGAADDGAPAEGEEDSATEETVAPDKSVAAYYNEWLIAKGLIATETEEA